MDLIDSRSFVVRALYGSPRGQTRRGPVLGGVFRLLMILPALLYALVMAVRRFAYAHGMLRVHKLGVPVISVGNLSSGGTGKTPMVEWVARWLQAQGRKPATLSRGYRSESVGSKKGQNDEALMLTRSLPDVPHYADPDRVRSGKKAIADGADCLVLDDGFQHMRIHRDVNIVLLDAIEQFGCHLTLPAGTLREMPGALGNADAIILTRVDAIPAPDLERLLASCGKLSRGKTLCKTIHSPKQIRPINGTEGTSPENLAGQKVGLFCGIGNPWGFLATVQNLEAEVVSLHFLPDHCPYDETQLARLAERFDMHGADIVLTTEKDAVKIGNRWPGKTPLHILSVEIAFIAGQEQLEELLRTEIAR